MQTQMAEAMNKALVAQGMKPKTQIELIWRYIKDHPGTKLKTLEAIFKRSTIHAIMQEVHQDSGPRTREASIGVIRETYYSWSAFSDRAVRKLAYTKCMAEVPPAVRADIRAE